MSQLVTFAEPFEAEKIKIDLNRCIREGREVDPDSFNNSRLISYWFLIKSIKEDMFTSAVIMVRNWHTLATNNVVVRVMFAPMIMVCSNLSIVSNSLTQTLTI